MILFAQALSTGAAVAKVIRRMGISEKTFYRLEKVSGGLGVGKLKLFEQENRKLYRVGHVLYD